MHLSLHCLWSGALAVGLGLSAVASVSDSGGEVTPEAAKLHETLRRTTAAFETLTWRVRQSGNESVSVGLYAKGRGLKLTSAAQRGESGREDYFLPDGYLRIQRSEGVVSTQPDYMALALMPFCVPLLETSQLRAFVRVEALASPEGESTLRLVTSGLSRFSEREGVGNYRYRTAEGRLLSVSLDGGYGQPYGMVVTQYQEVAGGAFPVHFRATGSGYHQALALEIVDVVANASVSDSAFRPDLRGLVFLHEGLAPDALRAKLTGETDPAVKAGLEYSLAVRLSRDAGGRAEAKEACQRAIELAPDTVAPRLLLADLTGGEPSDSAASGLESLLERFPASRDAIYPRLLEPMLRREGGDLRPATDLVAKWRKDCPDSLGAIGMAIRVGQRNRDPAALLELDKSLANGVSAPLRLQYRTSIVRALVSLGETNQAGRVLAAVTAAVLDPGDSPAAPYVVRELRVLHEKAGSLNGFMQDLSERHAKAPRNTVVLSLLANVSMEGKDYARAAGYCGALRELEPQNPVWIGLLAQVYQRQNDQTQLVALCESVLASPPDGLRETLEPQLLAAYRAAGQQAKAESLATRLLSDTNCPRQTLDALARHFEEQKATAKAIDVYRRLARQSEDGTGRRYYLSQFLRLCLDGERLDEAKGALDELEKSGDPRSSVGDPVGLGELAHLRIAYLKKADGLDAYVAEAERQAADKTND